MNEKKKSRPLRTLFFFLFLGFAVYLLLQIRIDFGDTVRAYLQRNFGDLLHNAGFKSERISLDVKGQVYFKNLCLGNPEVLRVPNAGVRISLWKFLRGGMVLQSVVMDSVIIRPAGMFALAEAFKGEFTSEARNRMNRILKKSGLSAEYFAFLDTAGEKTMSGRGVVLKISSSEEGNLYSDISLSRLFVPHVPGLKFLTCSLVYQPDQLALRNLELKWMRGSLSGRLFFPLEEGKTVSGRAQFKNLDLRKLTQKGYFKKSQFFGIASGNLVFKNFSRETFSLDMDGNIRVTSARLKNFPFQKDAVISNYMPELADVRFKTIDIPRLRVRNRITYLDSIAGRGNPLSFEGKGTITGTGYIDIYLLCHLKEPYYQSLKGLVKDGISRDTDSIPTFECRIRGDQEKQSIFLGKVIGKVVKTKIQRLGNRIRNLFR
ncbi:hypothetical protein ACFL5V_09505 [Fibrobacterota bacterium]